MKSHQSVPEAAQQYRKRGWYVIPLDHASKKPSFLEWQEAKLDQQAVDRHLLNGGNCGIALGKASANLADVDHDWPETVSLSSHFLPSTDCIFGRKSARTSHLLYTIADLPDEFTKKDYRDPTAKKDRATIVELRANGHQTMFPCSIHPDGELVEWELDGAPGQATFLELSERVARLAAAALLVRHYPASGSRHQFSLALSGMLLRSGWTSDETSHFVRAVAVVAVDEEAEARVKNVASTAERLEQDGKCTGIPTLSDLLDNRVVSKVCEWLGIDNRTARQPLASKADQVKTVNFEERDGKTFAIHHGRNGEVRTEIANFTARINREIQIDDGQEIQRRFEITVRLAGRTITVEVPAHEYAGMEWILTRVGAEASIAPKCKDEVRAAMQRLSGQIPVQRRFCNTGWHTLPSGDVFLHAGGAIGSAADGADIQVELPPPLRFVHPVVPQSHEALVEAYEGIKRFRSLIPAGLSYSLSGAVGLAIIDETDVSIALVGIRRIYKTETGKLCQAHFGVLPSGAGLPSSYASTANSNEILAYSAKNIVLGIDDFSPSGSTADVLRAEKDMDRLVRANGNRAGRSRLTRDSKWVEGRPPRCLLLSTGERLPGKSSLVDRCFVIDMQDGDVSSESLTSCQRDAESGLYARYTGAYISWLAPRLLQVRSRFLASVGAERNKLMASGLNERFSTYAAKLMFGFEVLLEFEVDLGLASQTIAAEAKESLRTTVTKIGAAQAEVTEAVEPVQAFQSCVMQALASGSAHLSTRTGEAPPPRSDGVNALLGWRLSMQGNFGGWQPSGRRIGFVEGDDVFLLPRPTMEIVKQMAGADVSAIVGERQLILELARRGLLRSHDKDRGLTKRMQVDGHRVPTWHVGLAWLVASDLPPSSESLSDGDDDGAGEFGIQAA